MRCIAIILAAGQEMAWNLNIPKPFVNVFDKPILFYTLEVFEKHPQIDAIEVVCLDGWEKVTQAYARQFNIEKLKWIVKGGENIQHTIRNGLAALKEELTDDDFVVIHDGIRPLVEESVLTDTLFIAMEKGNAISSMPNKEQVFIVNDQNHMTTKQFIPREIIRRVTTPQVYNYKELYDIYKYAFEHKIGIEGPSYADTLFADFGKKLYFAAGSDKNIKINTEEDLSIFEAYLTRDRTLWLK